MDNSKKALKQKGIASYLKKSEVQQPSINAEIAEKAEHVPPQLEIDSNIVEAQSSKRTCEEVDLAKLPDDPGKRCKISSYHANIQNEVRRYYLLKGPHQPRDATFEKRQFGKQFRRFVPDWFDDFSSWLEYSEHKHAAFCLHCYLFKSGVGDQGGGETFVTKGFNNWKNKEALTSHENSESHLRAVMMCDNLLKERQHVDAAFMRLTNQARADYRIRLKAAVETVRLILHQGFAFRGNDESVDSVNKGNYLELLKYLGNNNGDIKRVFDNAPQNAKLIASSIQKDIANAAAVETRKALVKELGNEVFAILVDEARDVDDTEQMAVVVRYVNKEGRVIESFLEVVNVSIGTDSPSLKMAIDSVLERHGLSWSKVCGQGYDGASNMQGEFNGLKALILRENSSAYYIHCFAHQLQLALVAVARDNKPISLFFDLVSTILNIVGGSCKRKEALRQMHLNKITEGVDNGEICTGRGKNQEITLKRPGDTRWGSHYTTLVRLFIMFPSIIEVLKLITTDGKVRENRATASGLVKSMRTFDFVFKLHMMKSILGITNDLSVALQRKDQDIVNAMRLVQVSKHNLLMLRDDTNEDSGWPLFLKEVCSFCEKNNISIPNLDAEFVEGSSRHGGTITSLHHYKVELFNEIIDTQLRELGDRFTEMNKDLLICVASLNPANNFEAFDQEKLIRLANMYPSDFSAVYVSILHDQLKNYIVDMRSNADFSGLKDIGRLSEKLVETKKDKVYPLVYLLIKLSLTLPVATTSVERAFSAMKIIKNKLRNRIGDGFMNDCLVTYIEKRTLATITDHTIMEHFQNMKKRRLQL